MPDTFSSPARSPGFHRFAVVCAGATFILIFVGGLVTSTGSALAVPDWPLAFGKVIPQLEGGVRFEYGHRVAAGLVVILTLILAAWSWQTEPRRWVRKAVLAVLGLIVLQAILGGLTVLLLLPLPIAVAHAGTGQALFCLMVSIAVFTDPHFGNDTLAVAGERRPALTPLAVITTVVIYLQILIGALMRHLGAGLAIPDFPLAFGGLIPPFSSIYVGINFAHRGGALLVVICVIWTVVRAMRFYRRETRIARLALELSALLLLQVTLGAVTIRSARAVLPTTAHVAVGAAVLATSLVLAIRAYAIGGLAAVAEAAKLADELNPEMEPKLTA
jgi:cytochrome c oxidase assembly protein subunit 15